MIPIKMLKVGEPSPITGRIFPREEIELAIERFDVRCEDGYDRLGECGEFASADPIINLDRVSHKIIDTYIDEDGWWVGVISPLKDTPMGSILQTIVEAKITPKLAPRCVGLVDNEGVVSDFEIISLDVYAGQD